MKNLSCTLLFSLLAFLASAQYEDKVRVFGYDYTGSPPAEGINFTFGDSLEITFLPRNSPLGESTTSICDSSGNLLLVSNGCYVEDGNGDLIPGSEGLNLGLYYDNFCAEGYGYNSPQNMVLLPDPGNPAFYHLFHYPVIQQDGTIFAPGVWHTVVDIATPNTLLLNNALFYDSLSADGLHAVKHANGRDWWVISTKKISNKYYLLLLTPSGVTVSEQSIGEPTWSGAGGEIVFSPDGSKIARYNPRDDLRIFDFDRCTGELSNPIYIPIQDDTDTKLSGGLAFSADSRYLYEGSQLYVHQYDMQAADIAASRTFIIERDDYTCPFPTSYTYMELGPDGKIYSRPASGQRCMHYIEHPERAGTACEVHPHAIEFPTGFDNLTHFPNFRLGPIDGSSCDTLGLDNHPLAGWRYQRTLPLTADFTSVSWFEPVHWYWEFEDGGTSTERNPTHTFPSGGYYEVCLTVSNQYGADTKCKTVWVGTTGAGQQPLGAAKITARPNPASGTVHLDGLQEGAHEVHIYNALGHLLSRQTCTNARVDVEGLPDGLYQMQVFKNGAYLSVVKIAICR